MELAKLIAALYQDPMLPPGAAFFSLFVALSFAGIGMYLMRVSMVEASGVIGPPRIHDLAAFFGGASHFFVGYFMVGWALAEAAPAGVAPLDAFRWFPGHMIGLVFWWLFVRQMTSPLPVAPDDSALRKAAVWLFDLPRSAYFLIPVVLVSLMVTVGHVFPQSSLAQLFTVYESAAAEAGSETMFQAGPFYWVEALTVVVLMAASFAHLVPVWWEQRSDAARKLADRTISFLAVGAFCLMAGALYLAVVIEFELPIPVEIGILLFIVGVFLTGHGLHVNNGLRIGGVYRRRFAWPILLGPLAATAVLLLLLGIGEAQTTFNTFAVFSLAATFLAVSAFASDQLRRSLLSEQGAATAVESAVESIKAGTPAVFGTGALGAAPDGRPGRDILSQSPSVIGLELIRPALRHFRNHGKIVADSSILLDLELVTQQRQSSESRVDALRRILAGLVEMEKPLPFPKQASKITGQLELSASAGAVQRYVALKYWWVMHVPHNPDQRCEAREDLYVDYYRAVESGDRFTVEIVDKLIELCGRGNRGRAVLRKWRDAGCIEIARRLQRREAEARKNSA